MRVDGRGGGVHVAVLAQVGAKRAHQVGGVLLVVARQRRDRVLVEAADLLGVAGQHAEQQPVGAAADLVARGPSPGRCHAQHQLGLLERAAHVGGIGVVRGQADQGLAAQAVGHLAGRVHRAGQQRVDAPAPPAVAITCASAPGISLEIAASSRAGCAFAGIGAQPDSALAEVAPQPARPAHDVARVQVLPGQQLLEEGAAQVLLGLVAGLGHRDLGQRGHRGHVQVLAGVGPARRRASAPRPAPGRRRRSAPRPRPRPGGRACRRPCAWPRSARTGAHASDGVPSRGTTTATGAPVCCPAISATRSRPSPASTAPTISRCAPRGEGRDSGAVMAMSLPGRRKKRRGRATQRAARHVPQEGSGPRRDLLRPRGPGGRRLRPHRCGSGWPTPPG